MMGGFGFILGESPHVDMNGEGVAYIALADPDPVRTLLLVPCLTLPSYHLF